MPKCKLQVVPRYGVRENGECRMMQKERLMRIIPGLLGKLVQTQCLLETHDPSVSTGAVDQVPTRGCKGEHPAPTSSNEEAKIDSLRRQTNWMLLHDALITYDMDETISYENPIAAAYWDYAKTYRRFIAYNQWSCFVQISPIARKKKRINFFPQLLLMPNAGAWTCLYYFSAYHRYHQRSYLRTKISWFPNAYFHYIGPFYHRIGAKRPDVRQLVHWENSWLRARFSRVMRRLVKRVISGKARLLRYKRMFRSRSVNRRVRNLRGGQNADAEAMQRLTQKIHRLHWMRMQIRGNTCRMSIYRKSVEAQVLLARAVRSMRAFMLRALSESRALIKLASRRLSFRVSGNHNPFLLRGAAVRVGINKYYSDRLRARSVVGTPFAVRLDARVLGKYNILKRRYYMRRFHAGTRVTGVYNSRVCRTKYVYKPSSRRLLRIFHRAYGGNALRSDQLDATRVFVHDSRSGSRNSNRNKKNVEERDSVASVYKKYQRVGNNAVRPKKERREFRHDDPMAGKWKHTVSRKNHARGKYVRGQGQYSARGFSKHRGVGRYGTRSYSKKGSRGSYGKRWRRRGAFGSRGGRGSYRYGIGGRGMYRGRGKWRGAYGRRGKGRWGYRGRGIGRGRYKQRGRCVRRRLRQFDSKRRIMLLRPMTRERRRTIRAIRYLHRLRRMSRRRRKSLISSIYKHNLGVLSRMRTENGVFSFINRQRLFIYHVRKWVARSIHMILRAIGVRARRKSGKRRRARILKLIRRYARARRGIRRLSIIRTGYSNRFRFFSKKRMGQSDTRLGTKIGYGKNDRGFRAKRIRSRFIVRDCTTRILRCYRLGRKRRKGMWRYQRRTPLDRINSIRKGARTALGPNLYGIGEFGADPRGGRRGYAEKRTYKYVEHHSASGGAAAGGRPVYAARQAQSKSVAAFARAGDHMHRSTHHATSTGKMHGVSRHGVQGKVRSPIWKKPRGGSATRGALAVRRRSGRSVSRGKRNERELWMRRRSGTTAVGHASHGRADRDRRGVRRNRSYVRNRQIVPSIGQRQEHPRRRRSYHLRRRRRYRIMRRMILRMQSTGLTIIPSTLLPKPVNRMGYVSDDSLAELYDADLLGTPRSKLLFGVKRGYRELFTFTARNRRLNVNSLVSRRNHAFSSRVFRRARLRSHSALIGRLPTGWCADPVSSHTGNSLLHARGLRVSEGRRMRAVAFARRNYQSLRTTAAVHYSRERLQNNSTSRKSLEKQILRSVRSRKISRVLRAAACRIYSSRGKLKFKSPSFVRRVPDTRAVPRGKSRIRRNAHKRKRWWVRRYRVSAAQRGTMRTSRRWSSRWKGRNVLHEGKANAEFRRRRYRRKHRRSGRRRYKHKSWFHRKMARRRRSNRRYNRLRLEIDLLRQMLQQRTLSRSAGYATGDVASVARLLTNHSFYRVISGGNHLAATTMIRLGKWRIAQPNVLYHLMSRVRRATVQEVIRSGVNMGTRALFLHKQFVSATVKLFRLAQRCILASALLSQNAISSVPLHSSTALLHILESLLTRYHTHAVTSGKLQQVTHITLARVSCANALHRQNVLQEVREARHLFRWSGFRYLTGDENWFARLLQIWDFYSTRWQVTSLRLFKQHLASTLSAYLGIRVLLFINFFHNKFVPFNRVIFIHRLRMRAAKGSGSPRRRKWRAHRSIPLKRFLRRRSKKYFRRRAVRYLPFGRRRRRIRVRYARFISRRKRRWYNEEDDVPGVEKIRKFRYKKLTPRYPPMTSAKIVCEYIRNSIEEGIYTNRVFRSIKYWQKGENRLYKEFMHEYPRYYYRADKKYPVDGLRILVSGPVKKARRKRRIYYHEWVRSMEFTRRLPLQTFEKNIEYYHMQARRIASVVGIKVWIAFKAVPKRLKMGVRKYTYR